VAPGQQRRPVGSKPKRSLRIEYTDPVVRSAQHQDDTAAARMDLPEADIADGAGRMLA
jgi:hypothetical protein